MSCSCDEYDNDERSLVPSRKKRRILMNNKMVDDQHNPVVVANKNKKEPAAPPVLDVFTAVVLKVNHNDSGNTQGENPAKNNNNEDDDSCFVAPAQSLYLFKTFSILLGLLIGAFIQFSSLGANYLVEQIGWQHQQQQQQEQEQDSPYQSAWWGWALVWSMGTSTVGVLVLLALRSLLQEIGTPTGSLNNNSKIRPHQQQRALLLLIMECHFAVGALAGVCLAWMGTDVVLKSSRHLIHSAVTLVAALAWCKLLSSWCFPVLAASAMGTSRYHPANTSNDKDYDESRWEALNDVEEANDCTVTSSTSTTQLQQQQRPNRFWVQCTSLFLGALIGIFIQYSSLGANFLIQHLHSSAETELDASIKFSLAWSVFTSGMGIAILFLIRGLLILLSGHHNDMVHNSDNATRIHLHNDCHNNLMTVECFFATGAVLGLNLAWTATDLMLGLGSHVTSSVLTLVGTLVWCKLVLYCCGYGRSNDGEEVEEEDADLEMGWCS